MVFLVLPLLPAHCSCRGLLFYLTTHMDTYTLYTTPLEEGSAYPAIPASEWPQAYVVYCAVAGIGYAEIYNNNNNNNNNNNKLQLGCHPVAVVILHVHKYGGRGEVTRKFKSGGLHERHVVATWKLGNHLSIRL